MSREIEVGKLTKFIKFAKITKFKEFTKLDFTIFLNSDLRFDTSNGIHFSWTFFEMNFGPIFPATAGAASLALAVAEPILKYSIFPFRFCIIIPGLEAELVVCLVCTPNLEAALVVKHITRVVEGLAPELVDLTKNFGFIAGFNKILFDLNEVSSSSSVYPDPESGVNPMIGKSIFNLGFCCSVNSRIILAISDRLDRITSLENHLRKPEIGRAKSAIGVLKKLSAYCKAKSPQSEKLGC